MTGVPPYLRAIVVMALMLALMRHAGLT